MTLTSVNMTAANRVFGKELGVFGTNRGLAEGVARHSKLIVGPEAKILPIHGTEIFPRKTVFTVREWTLYLKEEGHPERQQPNPKQFTRTDENPVLNVSWNNAVRLC